MQDDARGQHVANLMAFKPEEQIAQVLSFKDYNAAPFLVLATKGGLVKRLHLLNMTHHAQVDLLQFL